MSDALAFYELLFGRCTPADGEVVVCRPGRPLGLFPLDQIDEAIARGHRTPDSYFKPNLVDGDRIRERWASDSRYAVGTDAEVKTIIGFQLDCDANKTGYLSRGAMLEALDAMPRKPTVIVNSSGSVGGFYAYWCLAEPYRLKSDADRQYISTLAHRWQAKLHQLAGGKLDATADLSRMLRFIGNRRSNGNAVEVHSMNPERLYGLHELALPLDQPALMAQSMKQAERIVKRAIYGNGDTEKPVDDYIAATGMTVDSLLARHNFESLGPDQWMRPKSESKAKTFARATENGRVGVNAFSGNETRFPPCKPGQAVGTAFYALNDMFVRLEHNGDWKKAATWCRNELDKSNGVDLTEFMKKWTR